MSQGYSYAPPTLDEAIKAYQRAKEKARQIEKLSKARNSQPHLPVAGRRTEAEFIGEGIKPRQGRRRLYSQGSIPEQDDSDSGGDRRRRREVRERQLRARRSKRGDELDLLKLSTMNNVQQQQQLAPAWTQQYPLQQFPGFQPQFQHSLYSFYNPYGGQQPPFYQPYPPPQPYPYPAYHHHPPHPVQPPPVQYNMQPAEPMRRADFVRDCKYSPAPSRPYSDSDLLETVSTRAVRDSQKFSVIPPIRRETEEATAAAPVRRIREKFYTDFLDKLIDDLLVEELLPDLLVEVLLYGAKGAEPRLPSTTERVVEEAGEELVEEALLSLLHSTVRLVLSEEVAVYRRQEAAGEREGLLEWTVDELIAGQLREVVSEFLREGVMEVQCERVFNQLVYETVCGVVMEEVRGTEEEEEKPEVGRRGSKVSVDLDNVILASVLCRSLVPSEDYILDGIIAQGLANQLRVDGDK